MLLISALYKQAIMLQILTLNMSKISYNLALCMVHRSSAYNKVYFLFSSLQTSNIDIYTILLKIISIERSNIF